MYGPNLWFGFLECMSLVLCRHFFKKYFKRIFKLRSRRVVSLSRNQIPGNCQSFISLMYVCKNSLYHVLSPFKVMPGCLLMWTKHFLKLQFPWLKRHRFPSTRPPPRIVLQNHSNKIERNIKRNIRRLLSK